MEPNRRRISGLACALLALASLAHAQDRGGDDRLDRGRFAQPPRFRLCCAFGTGARIDIGASHAPVLLDMVGSADALGHHSYLGFGKFAENNGLVYTCRGGFIDVAHVRETGDWTAYLATRLRARLGREATLPLTGDGPERALRLRATAAPADADATSIALGQRIAWELMFWSEIEQWAGLLDVAGIYEKPSGLSPDDPYSNLLGVYVAARALVAPGNYEDNFDRELRAALLRLGAVSAGATREALWRVNGRWWDAGRAWPDALLTMRRSTTFGATLEPMLVDPAPPECARVETQATVPEVLVVPQQDAAGVDLASYYALEIHPDLREALGPADAARFRNLTPAQFPALVASLDAKEQLARARDPGRCGLDDPDCDRAVGHYMNGLRLFVLEALGGAHRERDWDAGYGGRFAAVDAQTRGGNLKVLAVQVVHDRGPRGLATTLAFARTDELYFCEEPGRGTVHPPFLGWMRACKGDGTFFFGGDIGELQHDGDTGRTVVRPLSLRIGLNPLANGYAESYDHVRLFAWIGGSFDNVWTATTGPELSPRAQAGLRFLLRSPAQRWELDLRGVGNLDPWETTDRGVEGALALARLFLLGGGGDDNPDETPNALHRTVPWAMLRIAIEGSYSRFDEPKNAFATVAGPFVSDRSNDTYQALLSVGITPTAMTF